MNSPTRQIMTPGESPEQAAQPAASQASAPAAAPAVPALPAPERRKPGPKPRVAVAPAGAGQASDDLDEFDSDDLPPTPAVAEPGGFTAAQRALVAAMIADAVRASKGGQDPLTAAKIATKTQDRLPTQADAHAVAEDSIARGIRPRPVLTADGWYVHREMARSRDHGVSRLPVD